MGDHAKLSPSAAKRWLTCPASVEASARSVSPDTEDSKRGTAGHWVHEVWLTTGAPPPVGAVAPNGIVVDDEMVEYVGQSIGWIKRYLDEHKGCVVMCEEKIQIGDYFGLEKSWCYGTADTVILAAKELVVHDLKMGYVDVQAEKNPQLMLYALGLCGELGWLWPEIRLVILQPKNGGPKEWTLSMQELAAWAEEQRPKVVAATLPDAPFVPSEEGCRYCPNAGVCKALQQNAIEIARREFDTPAGLIENISPDDLGLLLQKADLIDAALKAAREHGRKLLQCGVDVPGFKLVEARTKRRWRSGVEAEVEKLIGEAAWDKSLISFTQAEKIAGKEKIAPFIETPRGDVVLAPMSDKRPAIGPQFEAVEMGGLLE
jgi:hypothetical protein